MKTIEINQKPYKCTFVNCKVRFTDRRNIPRHIQNKHSTNKQQLQCILCKKLYLTKGNHDQHFENAHMGQFLLYTTPETVNVKVRKSDTKRTSNSMVSRNRKQKLKKFARKVKYVGSRKMYGNPFGKDHFCTSEADLAEKDYLERRKMMIWFEEAQIELRYF